MRKSIFLVIIFILLTLAAGSLFLLQNARDEPAAHADAPAGPEDSVAAASETAEDFMQALEAENYPLAYALCTPALQDSFEDLEGFSAFFEEHRLQLQDWSWTSQAGDEKQVYFNGAVTFEGRRRGSVSIDLDQSGAGWQVSDLILQPAR
jgi:hypothetical protein